MFFTFVTCGVVIGGALTTWVLLLVGEIHRLNAPPPTLPHRVFCTCGWQATAPSRTQLNDVIVHHNCYLEETA